MTQFIVMKKKRVPEDQHQRNAFLVDPPLIREKSGSRPIHANTSMSYPGNERLSRMADRVESARLRIWDVTPRSMVGGGVVFLLLGFAVDPSFFLIWGSH